MSLSTVQATNNSRIGTCPHGLPLGACPICNGMGGGAKKADFSAKPGEMSWNECAAIGAFLKAQKMAKLQRQQDVENFAKQAAAFDKAMLNASQKTAALASFFTTNTPSIIAKPVNFVLNTIVGGVLNTIRNFPQTVQTVFQKLADISDKLTAVYGEVKAAIAKKISETFGELKKKIKSLFQIFGVQNSDNDDKQIDETKKAFKLKTFIHDLYKKLRGEEEKDIEENAD